MLRQDWPAYLGRLLRAFEKFPSDSALIQSVGRVETSPFGNDDTVILKYFTSVSKRMDNLTKNYVQINFELAAIHLAIMLKVMFACVPSSLIAHNGVQGEPMPDTILTLANRFGW
jgi:hypothetical protein